MGEATDRGEEYSAPRVYAVVLAGGDVVRVFIFPPSMEELRARLTNRNTDSAQVIEARAKATAIQATPELVNDPVAFQKFQQAQKDLSGSLSRLLMVSENYPTLRANQGSIDLQAQLEGTENRIAVARNRYIKAVQDYNVTVHSFPSNLTAWALGYKEKPNFSVENEQAIARPPTVDFGTAPAKPSATVPGDAK